MTASVSRSKKPAVDLAGDVIDLGNNRFKITYFSEKLNHGITFEDKESHPDEDETDDYGEWLDLLTRLFWIAAIVVFLGFGFYLISRRIDQHFQRLVKVSEQISASNFEVKVPIDSPPPIKNLANKV